MSERGEDQTNERKIEHIRAIERDPATDRDGRWFDRILLEHRPCRSCRWRRWIRASSSSAKLSAFRC